MLLTRRSLLPVVAAGLTAGAVAPVWAAAPDTAAAETERAIGKPDAKVTVMEFFSLTCTHCAAFSRETLPQVQAKLIDTGKVRYVFRDFPLDQVALLAAMVARSLPPERYEPFINALFASQDRWAFARGINTTEEIWKFAALAGMSRATFDAAVANNDLRSWILAQQNDDQQKYHIDSTPSFLINGQTHSGEMSYDEFSKLIPDVS